MAITIIPDANKPLPDDFESEEPTSFYEKAKVSTATAKYLLDAGAKIPVSTSEELQAEKLFKEITNPDVTPVLNIENKQQLEIPAVVQKLTAMITAYDHEIIQDAVQVRRLVTNKLLEDADHADARHRLKALELLGKISDVGLFSEKTEITVKHLSPDDLETQIKSKLFKILGKTTAIDGSFEVVADEKDITPEI
jgi:hypothetical protein